MRNTNDPTLNLNISESNRARAKLQTSGDDKNPQFEPQKVVQKYSKIAEKMQKSRVFFY